MLVEDHPVLSRMYSQKFELEGFDVYLAKDGEEALSIIFGKGADIILLDVLIPKIDGLTLLERLRNDPVRKDIPVIVLTNVVKKNERDRALNLGAKEYLVKAMQTPEQVVNSVKKYI